MVKGITRTLGELFAPKARMQRDERSQLDFRFVGSTDFIPPERLAEAVAGAEAEALALARTQAIAGNPQAQTAYGHMLLLGHGTEAAPEQAFQWFSRAAESDYPDAINMVGRCFENGWGVAADPAAAVIFYHRAAEQGHIWACFNFAMMLFDGNGCDEDRAGALEWFLRAGRARHAKAMNMLGRYCEDGMAGRVRMVQAFNWYRRAAAGDDFRGQFNFGRLLFMAGQRAPGLSWIERSISHGIPEFCANAGQELLASGDPDLMRLGQLALRRAGSGPT